MYKNVTLNTHKKWPFPQHHVHASRAGDDATIKTYFATQCLASKCTITACLAKVKFKICHFYIVLMGTLEVNIFS